MSRPVPAATATLRVLRFLSSQPSPVSATYISESVGIPRSSTYHLLTAMAEEDFVIHYRDDRTWGMGLASWEVGHGFAQHEPLTRLARVPLARLVDTIGETAHLAMLHGSEVLYLVEERAPGRPPLVTDVGVRLPAHLTASGRAILAALPAAQVRAIYPNPGTLISRTEAGPATLMELRNLLVEVRKRGYAEEGGEVTEGFSSVAIGIGAASIHASAAVTWRAGDNVDVDRLIGPLRSTVRELQRRIRRN